MALQPHECKEIFSSELKDELEQIIDSVLINGYDKTNPVIVRRPRESRIIFYEELIQELKRRYYGWTITIHTENQDYNNSVDVICMKPKKKYDKKTIQK